MLSRSTSVTRTPPFASEVLAKARIHFDEPQSSRQSTPAEDQVAAGTSEHVDVASRSAPEDPPPPFGALAAEENFAIRAAAEVPNPRPLAEALEASPQPLAVEAGCANFEAPDPPIAEIRGLHPRGLLASVADVRDLDALPRLELACEGQEPLGEDRPVQVEVALAIGPYGLRQRSPVDMGDDVAFSNASRGSRTVLDDIHDVGAFNVAVR